MATDDTQVRRASVTRELAALFGAYAKRIETSEARVKTLLQSVEQLQSSHQVQGRGSDSHSWKRFRDAMVARLRSHVREVGSEDQRMLQDAEALEMALVTVGVSPVSPEYLMVEQLYMKHAELNHTVIQLASEVDLLDEVEFLSYKDFATWVAKSR